MDFVSNLTDNLFSSARALRVAVTSPLEWGKPPSAGQFLQEKLLQAQPESHQREFVVEGCLCCYTSFALDEDAVLGCTGDEELCCLKLRYCLACNMPEMGPSVSFAPEELGKEGSSLCTLSAYCLEFQLNNPTTLFRSTGASLCIRKAAAFPFMDPVPLPVCAVCCLRLLPRPIGLFAPPVSGGPMPLNLLMERSTS